MKGNKILLATLFTAYAILWLGGVVSYIFLGGPPADSHWTAPVFLALAATTAFILTAPAFRLSLLTAGFLGLAAEFAGVRWGYPFGRYAYTLTLFPRILGVPVVIGCAWLLLFAYVKSLLYWCGINKAWQPLCGAAWMVALDLLIDPLASGPLNYWAWLDHGWYYGIPLMNFAGWFLVSLVLFYVFRKPWSCQPHVAGVGLSIVMFFSVIALARSLWGPLLIGLALCLLHGWLWRRRRGQARGL